VQAVALSMSRARYRETKKHLHIADNTALPPDKKMDKLRPIPNLDSARFHQFGVFSTFLSAREQIL